MRWVLIEQHHTNGEKEVDSFSNEQDAITAQIRLEFQTPGDDLLWRIEERNDDG